MARFEKRGKVFEITSSDARYTTELRQHLQNGWTRVCDPRCEVPLGAEPINPVLEEALRAEPDDPGAALVYADWLQQQGHPRGALITVQHRLALTPNDAELLAAEQRILDESGDALVSRPLRAHLALYRDTHEIAGSFYSDGRAVFEHGFIREARVVLHRRGGDEDLLWELLRHPSARALAKLGVRVQPPRDIALAVALLVHGARPPLRTLALQTMETTLHVDLTGLDAAYPQLESLNVTVTNMKLGDLRLPALRQLVVHAERHDLGRIFTKGNWPALRTLVIGGDAEQLALAFREPSFPSLVELQLGPSPRPLFVCRMLVQSPCAATLEQLRLVDTPLDLECVTMLVEQRARFPRLQTLAVQARSDLSERLRAAGYPLDPIE